MGKWLNNERNIMGIIQSIRIRLDYFKNCKKYIEEQEEDVRTISRLENEIRKNKEMHSHELENKDMILDLQKSELDKMIEKIRDLNGKAEQQKKLIKYLESDNNQLGNIIEIKTAKAKELKAKIRELNGKNGGLTKQNNILKQSLDDMTQRYNFALTKIPKKSTEEIKAYIYGNKEVLKRIKEKYND